MTIATDWTTAWTVEPNSVPAQAAPIRYVTTTTMATNMICVSIPTEEEHLRSSRANERRLDEALSEVFGD